MPYNSVKDLPKSLDKFSLKRRRQFLYVFNQIYEKVLKETNSKKEADKRAFKAAFSVIRKTVESHSNETDYKHDYFANLIDLWLKPIGGEKNG